MAIFQKKQSKETRAAISQALSDNPNQELKASEQPKSVAGQKDPTQSKHQFDDIGIKYEGKSHKRLILGVLMLFLIVAGVILFATPQGQSLLWQFTQQNSAASQTATTETQTTTSAGSITAMPLIAPRDFSEATENEIKQRLQSDVSDLDTILSNPTGFDTPDWQLEFGL